MDEQSPSPRLLRSKIGTIAARLSKRFQVRCTTVPDGRIAGLIRGGEDEKSCRADFNVAHVSRNRTCCGRACTAHAECGRAIHRKESADFGSRAKKGPGG